MPIDVSVFLLAAVPVQYALVQSHPVWNPRAVAMELQTLGALAVRLPLMQIQHDAILRQEQPFCWKVDGRSQADEVCDELAFDR